ncbi:DUF4259 domain-containing protein [Actinomadura madurae]|uniref:DUF4259 domain-containing protein n=1 Tax=Actinomadura madurae TaxID=1993 RepID=UPI000941DD97|nr:DUF4259 domain-containing protein [Actinomadura madurae]
MGTWGAGPFDSDTAEDFVDGLERLAVEERLAALERIFTRAIHSVELEESPGEVVAAAAVVAANLESGAALPWSTDYPGISAWLPEPVAAELSPAALRAMEAVIPADGWFRRSWVTNEERREAESVVDTLKSVLDYRR